MGFAQQSGSPEPRVRQQHPMHAAGGGGGGASSSGSPVRSRYPQSASPKYGGGEQGAGPSSSNGTYYRWPVAQQASSEQEALELEGTMLAISAGSGKFVPAPLSASSRETASQKAKLRALQKRREQSQAQPGNETQQAANRSKVRNYNIKDDHHAAEAAGPGTAAISTA